MVADQRRCFGIRSGLGEPTGAKIYRKLFANAFANFSALEFARNRSKVDESDGQDLPRMGGLGEPMGSKLTGNCLQTRLQTISREFWSHWLSQAAHSGRSGGPNRGQNSREIVCKRVCKLFGQNLLEIVRKSTNRMARICPEWVVTISVSHLCEPSL